MNQPDVWGFDGKIKAIKAVRDVSRVSVSQCAAHVASVMGSKEARPDDALTTIGLKEAKDLVESIMAYGVREHKAALHRESSKWHAEPNTAELTQQHHREIEDLQQRVGSLESALSAGIREERY